MNGSNFLQQVFIRIKSVTYKDAPDNTTTIWKAKHITPFCTGRQTASVCEKPVKTAIPQNYFRSAPIADNINSLTRNRFGGRYRYQYLIAALARLQIENINILPKLQIS